MDEYYDVLREFDNSYKEFLESINKRMYSDAAFIQGYLIGLVKALQILNTSETDIDLVAEIKKRVDPIS